MREKDWQQTILDAARYLGWTVIHHYDSRRSTPGFPDIIAIKPPRMLAIECKTERGKVTPAQQQWLDVLAGVPGVTAMVARPSDWDRVEAALKEPS